MEFKLWLCGEEIFRYLSIYANRINEAKNIAELMGASEINSIISNITGVEKHYLQLILIQARQLAKAGFSAEELANTAVAKIWKEKERIQNKIKTIRDTNKPLPTAKNPDPAPFASPEKMENYIVNFVVKLGVNGMLEIQRGGGQRSLSYLFKKYKKSVQDGKPFTGFVDNTAAKSAFISEFPSDTFDSQNFSTFLRTYGHEMAHDIAARSLVQGKADAEGEYSGRSIVGTTAGVGLDLEVGEMQDKLKSILQSMQRAANTDAKKRNIDNALLLVDKLHMAQEGHGWMKRAGDEVGILDSNLLKLAFDQLKLAAARLANSEGSEAMKDQVKQLTSNIPDAPVAPVAPAPVAHTSPATPSMPVSSIRPEMHDDEQGHDHRLGF